MAWATFIPLIAQGIAALAKKDDRKSHSRDDIEKASLREQLDLSRFLEGAITDSGLIGERADQLKRGGALPPDIAQELERQGARRGAAVNDPIAQALMGGPAAGATPGRGVSQTGAEADVRARSRRTRKSRLASTAAATKRSDIAEIFGGDLASRANIANSVTGQFGEKGEGTSTIQKLANVFGSTYSS